MRRRLPIQKKVKAPTKRQSIAQREADLEIIATAARRAGQASIQAVQQQANDALDARRWRALMSSERIRIATNIHQPHSNPVPGSKYLMLELWSHSDTPESRMTSHLLIDYVDFLIELEGMKGN